MHRAAPLLLLSGVALLVSWVLAPAAPSPNPLPSTPEMSAFDQTSMPIVNEMAAEVDRMKNRLDTPPSFPAPERNPFRFGERPEPAPRMRPAPVAAASPAESPALVLPRLLEIVATDGAETVVRTAAFAVGDDVRVVKIGDTIGGLVVRDISALVVELADPATGLTHHLTLR